MTHPKDVNKRRVILDLLYPRGASFNVHVAMNMFDHNDFILKLTCLDNIMRGIMNAFDPLPCKVEVALTFKDPADCVKFGIS